jgi:hypothetical protein
MYRWQIRHDARGKVGMSGVVRGVLTVGGLDDYCWWERQIVLLLHTD